MREINWQIIVLPPKCKPIPPSLLRNDSAMSSACGWGRLLFLSNTAMSFPCKIVGVETIRAVVGVETIEIESVEMMESVVIIVKIVTIVEIVATLFPLLLIHLKQF